MKNLKTRNKIKRIKKLVSIIWIILLISGCGVSPRVIDDISIIFGMAVEIDEDDNRILNITTTNITQEETSAEIVTQTGVQSFGIDGFLRNWQYQRHKRIALGKVQVMIFGERIMRDNFFDVIHQIRGVPEIDINSRVFFYDGNPQHALNIKVDEEERVAIYLRELVERNIETAVLPDVSFHSLFTDLVTRGKTAYMPYLEENAERSSAIIRGIALLDNKGQLATIIDEYEMMHFMLLTENKIGFIVDSKVEVADGKEAIVIYETMRNNINIDTKIVDGKPEIHIEMNPQLTIRQVSVRGVELIDEETFANLCEEIGRQLTVSIQKLLDKMQHHDVDPVGFGEKVRVRHKEYFRNDTWEEDYPTIKITNNVNVIVRRLSGFYRTE